MLGAGGADFALAAGWPMHRANAGRTSYTPEVLPPLLSLQWEYQQAHEPVPAWPNDARMASRITFDRTYHPVSDGSLVYFGSSADGKVYALSAVNGKTIWTFLTRAPVRFAPVLWKESLFVASDDGTLYCLSAKDGKLLWKKRGGPSDRMVIGNERMISKWPARGGPVVADGIVYFGAGIWPNDGIYIHALNAATGKTIWVNEELGKLDTGQPHRGGVIKSAYSCQGYLVVSGDKLIVPSGRSVPAVLNRADGSFLYYHMAKYGNGLGGSTVVAADTYIFNSGHVFSASNGLQVKALSANTEALAITPKYILSGAHSWGVLRLNAVDRATPLLKKEVIGKNKKKKIVEYRNNILGWKKHAKRGGPKHGAASLVVAAGTAILGGDREVYAVDIASSKVLWRVDVEGTILGLAVAGGQVFASNGKGTIYCFGSGAARKSIVSDRPAAIPFLVNKNYTVAAKEILEKTGIREGYCLDLGCGKGELVYELARQTTLRIIGIEKDPDKVAVARQKLDAAGLYGQRVTILQGDPAASHLPNYFANLVVSGSSVTGAPVPEQEALRCTRPYGGVIYTGKPGAMHKTVRGPLKGAGSWTHQYASAANKACSDDERVKGELTMLWFGGPDHLIADRHGRPPAPLFESGRMYVQGLKSIRGIDAYNGRLLWELPLDSITKEFGEIATGGGRTVMAGVPVTGNIMCAVDGMLYAHDSKHCLRIDGATGKILATFKAPSGRNGEAGIWGTIACDGNTLFGTLADDEYRITKKRILGESKALFALDPKDGKLKWRYNAEKSIRHNAIAIGGGTVYLIDRVPPSFERITFKKLAKGTPRPEWPTGTLLALNAKTGKVKWKHTEKINGSRLALSTEHNILIMAHQVTGYGRSSEGGIPLTSFEASTGKRLYQVECKYSGNPVIIDRTIYGKSRHYARSGAWDLLTGKRLPLKDQTRGGGDCGTMAGGRHILAFRAGAIGYVNLSRPKVVNYYGGARPGCFINAIPAGGLLLMPEYGQGCKCSYQLKTSLALEPKE